MMLDYGKMFLGLVVAGIILIVVGLMLARAQPRLDHADLPRPPLNELLRKASMVPPSLIPPSGRDDAGPRILGSDGTNTRDDD